MSQSTRILFRIASLLVLPLLAGCSGFTLFPSAPTVPPVIRQVDLSNPDVAAESVPLEAARNEWVGITLQIRDLPPDLARSAWLRIRPPRLITGSTAIAPEHFSAARVVSMPVDSSSAGYVRYTGLPATTRRLPGALLPARLENGLLSFASLPPADEPLCLWIDLHVPANTPAGEYAFACELAEDRDSKPLASLPLSLTVYDFSLPDVPRLAMACHLDWRRLANLYPDHFASIDPRFLNRTDPQYATAVKTLDQLIGLAHQHRAQLAVPRLQPTVKWPAAKPPQIDGRDLDSLLSPWMDGSAFADRIPQTYWPLPGSDRLDQFNLDSQLEYWSAAVSHFDRLHQLDRMPLVLDASADVETYLGLNPRPRIYASLPDELLPEYSADLHPLAPGLVWSRPIAGTQASVEHQLNHWLRADLPDTAPCASQQDVRLWACLAFLRQADLVLWKGALPAENNPARPASAGDLIWFYPGHWFGLDQPVASVQLKWLRTAEQDFEYLVLASQHGRRASAMRLARLIARPIDLAHSQQPDPLYALLGGTADPAAWHNLRRLLARTILLYQSNPAPGVAGEMELNLQTLQWVQPQHRPLMIPRTAQWYSEPGANRVRLRLGLDIYNTSPDNAAAANSLKWGLLPPGWIAPAWPVISPPLVPYQVQRVFLDAWVDAEKIGQASASPSKVTFVSGYDHTESPLSVSVPAAACERRPTAPVLDGSLEDWQADDAIQSGPLVRLLDRPSLQRQALSFSAVPASVYTAWTDESFYVAFKAEGLCPVPLHTTRNFVEYQFRRAWGEDLAQILIQPIYPDNTLGPVLHMVCKPNGHWIERRVGNVWQPIEGTAIRYAATLDDAVWRGEVAIPWKALLDPGKPRPSLLRFNFVRHQTTTGRSDSWAGPLDFGRDDDLMGLLYLRSGSFVP